MKLCAVFAATTAIVGSSLITALPGKASLYVDLSQDKYFAVDDKKDFVFVTDGSSKITTHQDSEVLFLEVTETGKLDSYWKNKVKPLFEKYKNNPDRTAKRSYISVRQAFANYMKTGELPGDSSKAQWTEYYKPNYSLDPAPAPAYKSPWQRERDEALKDMDEHKKFQEQRRKRLQYAKTIKPSTSTSESSKKAVYQSSPGNSSPTKRVQKAEVMVSQNDFHEKCKDARDYQGCINAFTGGASSSSSGLSQYEAMQLELRRQELEQQRRTTRYNQMVEEQNRARQQRQQRNNALMQMIDGLGPKPSVTCTSTPNFFGGGSTTCQ